SLGASFRSSTEINMRGHTEYYNNTAISSVPAFPRQRVGAQAEIPFPLFASFGISYRPTPKWNVEFDADYTDWTLDTVTIRHAKGFGSWWPKNIPAQADWQPAWY